MAIADVLNNFDRLVDKLEKVTEKAVYEVSADLLRESNELTPFDTGDLRKSGKLRMKKGTHGIAGIVSYGDARVDYAAKVHEEKAKNYSEEGTSWKYLERPLKKNAMKYKLKLELAGKGVIK